MHAGTKLLLALCLGAAVATAGCGQAKGGLPTRYAVRAAAGPLQRTTVSEATLTARLGTPSLVVPAGGRASWYYAVDDGGAVKLSLVKEGEGSWRVDGLDGIEASEWNQQKPHK